MRKWPQYYNEEMETMSQERLRSFQEKKLKKQLQYVWKNSPFYQKKFRQVGFSPRDFKSLEELGKLPFTTKDETGIFAYTRRPNSHFLHKWIKEVRDDYEY
jgi:phenylacetate-coenzyme A ligase PaaK-like adenylate-forming protein